MTLGRRVHSSLMALLVASSALSLTTKTQAAVATGRLSVKVLDESGQPLADVELEFLPADQSGNAPRTFKTSQKGTFEHAFFPKGKYRVELKTAGRVIKSMTYVLKDASGFEKMRETGQAHHGTGLPPFGIGTGQRVELEIVLADREQREAVVDVASVDASAPLKTLHELYQAGDMQRVVAEADKLLAVPADSGQAYYLRGMALGRLERLDEAEASLRRAIELAPDHPGIDGALGTILLQKARANAKAEDGTLARSLFDEAAQHLERDLDRSPGSIPVLTNLVMALEGAGKDRELVDALEQLILLKPADAQLHMRLADAHLRAGRFDDAIGVLTAVPGARADVALRIYNVAARRFNEGDVGGAIATARKGIEIDQDLPQFYRLLGRAHASREEKAAAIEALEKLMALAPSGPEIEADRRLLEALKK